MERKKCSVCDEYKTLENFLSRKNSKCGYYAACRSCTRSQQATWRKSPAGREYGRLYSIEYRARKPEKQRDANRKWRQSDHGREYMRRNAEEFRINNPQKKRAQNEVAKAVKDGRMTRPESCVSCGTQCKPSGHHRLGYARQHWFDVQWLCRSCHYKADRGLLPRTA
jgi:hypothetical protein